MQRRERGRSVMSVDCNQADSVKEGSSIHWAFQLTSSMGSRGRVPVFADTNMGTRIAVDVSPDATVGGFKRDLEIAHLNCFPKLGEIRVNGLMVKRKSCFYHLPDSLPVKNAFQGLKGTWFIHMEGCFHNGSDKSALSESLAAEIRDQASKQSNFTDCLEPNNCMSSANKNKVNYKRKKRRLKGILFPKATLQVITRTIHMSNRNKRRRVKKSQLLRSPVKVLEKGHLGRNAESTAKESELFASRTEGEQGDEWKSSGILESPSKTISEGMSVSGIIKKYFSDHEEVTLSSAFTSRANQSKGEEQLTTSRANQSQHEEQLTTGTNDNCLKAKVSAKPRYTTETPPRMLPFPLPTDTSTKSSMNKFKRSEVGKRLLVASNKLGVSVDTQKSATRLLRFKDRKSLVSKSSLVRSLVFEISDSDG